ncbi:MAG: PTS sugar transporter subunit IIA [Thermoguttaceae bacterium]|nr:PTS sugar transporter subunit IIA [Thermoguttaceae bacterium]MBO7723573.1 PTS sugar transporter subunit IIA [Thermoguttaceae bacterium]MBQ2682268.1 PTS sugar transporter subunit IIA [Thermoguttaceae bacterium]MBQ3333865.1 PTS sugar transporter subunit IIA [Thermoguttaceae bacterium]MBQ3454243.1 PTS sugar transporter subunit IIA [Thermoguttaceae bacterium]
MKFSEFILVDAIRAEVKAKDKEGVVREMVKSIQDAGGIDESDYEGIVAAVLRREELGSTGIGRGVAVPHTKHPSLTQMVGTVAISQEGVEYESLDGEPVYLFVLLLSPNEHPGEHLRALEHITRMIKDDGFCRYLKQARDCSQIKQLLDEADRGEFTK